MKAKALFLVPLSAALVASAQVSTIETVIVGDPGNPSDSTGYGAVGHTYAIGKYEVTMNQYTAFLNAKAAADPFGLYDERLGWDLNIGRISRIGTEGKYAYGVIGDGNRPVTHVTFFSAVRYANWLHNGGGTGDTETGAYTLQGGGSLLGRGTPTNWANVVRNQGAKVWIPSENEWYKAAYYHPAAQGGDTDGYWLYPTKTNAVPTSKLPGSWANAANFFDGRHATTRLADRNTTQNYLTAVGAYKKSASHYGTYDQGGNAAEWNDTIFTGANTRRRGERGGGWYSPEELLRASSNYKSRDPKEAGPGFRIATVP